MKDFIVINPRIVFFSNYGPAVHCDHLKLVYHVGTQTGAFTPYFFDQQLKQRTKYLTEVFVY